MLNERDVYRCSPDNSLLGSDISQGLPTFLVQAWRGDSWVSAAENNPSLPPLHQRRNWEGKAGNQRQQLTSSFWVWEVSGFWAKRKPFTTQWEYLEYEIHFARENSWNWPPLYKNTSFFRNLPWICWKDSGVCCCWVGNFVLLPLAKPVGFLLQSDLNASLWSADFQPFEELMEVWARVGPWLGALLLKWPWMSCF